MRISVALLSVILGGGSGRLLCQSHAPTERGMAAVGGTIYTTPTADPIRNGVVLIENGKIAAVGSKASVHIPASFRVLDCSGDTILAGFWNSHVHFFERKWADAGAIPVVELTRQLQDMFTRYGFTSVFDLGSPWENTRKIRERVISGEVSGPRIRSTGEVLIAPGAMPTANILSILGDMSLMNREVTTAADVEVAAKAQLERGVDGIKFHLQPPPPPRPKFPLDGMRMAVGLAHDLNKPVFVHPSSTAEVVAAVQAGVDVIAHTTPPSGPWDGLVMAEIRGRKVALTPTLTLWKSSMRHDRVATQDRLTEIAVEQLRAWVAAGGPVLFGTDIGAIDYDPGEEYRLMQNAGLSFRQILASLTTAPATQFGEADRLGKITVGLDADLVILRGDPSRALSALGAVAYTVQGGRLIYESRP